LRALSNGPGHYGAGRMQERTNTLMTSDAGLIEDAFRARLAALTASGNGGKDGSPTASAGRRWSDRRERHRLPRLGRHGCAELTLDGAQPFPTTDDTRADEAGSPVARIDKGALALSEPRRHRDGAHLKFVTLQPCLLCGRRPSNAHHLRFAQAAALGRRVSAEFTVPLCRVHHRAARPRRRSRLVGRTRDGGAATIGAPTQQGLPAQPAASAHSGQQPPAQETANRTSRR
jgi:hypothetical protein